MSPSLAPPFSLSVLVPVYDELGAEILASLTQVQNIHRWMAATLLPHVGDQVLEIGAGLGNLTLQFLPRRRYVATDIDPRYLDYLEGLARGRPGLEVARADLGVPADFEPLAGQFDTVLCLNVLEHVDDEALALASIHGALAPGGKAIVLVPQGPWLFGSLDHALAHRRRYTRAGLEAAVRAAGLEVAETLEFNKVGVLGWAGNGLLLGRERFSRLQLKALNSAIPLIQGLDRRAPWPGLSLVVVARKPG
ncbi:MAG: class I SAM-dependent methyltransferase [Pseudomonadota bacterium]